MVILVGDLPLEGVEDVMQLTKFVSWAFLLLFCSLPSASMRAEEKSFVVLSQLETLSMLPTSRRKIIVDRMQRLMGIPLDIKYFATGCGLLQAALEQQGDVAVMTPMWVPLLVRDYGYKALLKTEHRMVVYLVYRKSSPFKNIRDIE